MIAMIERLSKPSAQCPATASVRDSAVITVSTSGQV
jgi:hypothetical protein